MRKTITAEAVAAVVLSAGLAMASPTPAQKCEAGKNGTAGKYAACLDKAQQKFVTGGGVDTAGRDAAVIKCGATYVAKWSGLETMAGAGICPSEGDALPIQDFLDACLFSAQDALEVGGTLPLDVVTCNGNYATCTGDLGTCNGSLTTCNGNYASCSGSLATANAGTAALGDVLATKTFTSTAGLGATGTMPNNGAVTLTPASSDQAIVAGYHNGTGKCAGDADLVAANVRNGVDLFGVAGTLGLQQTGQTTCYNTPGGVIPCAGTGQDGEFQRGVAHSFTDNGDGTITDNLTGLMWEKQSDDGSIHDKDNQYTWANGIGVKVAALNSGSFAGHADWRLPNLVELETLRRLVGGNSSYAPFDSICTAGCTVLTCSCTRPNPYWSSSTYQYSGDNAWIVYFGGGTAAVDFKTNNASVRGVRAGS